MHKVDDQVGASVFGVNLISRPPSRVRESMSLLQDSIQAAVPDTVAWRTPAESLHLSIFQFVWARIAGDADKEAAWRVREDDILGDLESAASAAAQILLSKAKLEVRFAAIILAFPPSSELETLRHRIGAFPSVSGLCSRRPHLQHVSLFRYLTKTSRDGLESACRDIEVDVPVWHVSEVELVRESVYPSLQCQVLQTFALADAGPTSECVDRQ